MSALAVRYCRVLTLGLAFSLAGGLAMAAEPSNRDRIDSITSSLMNKATSLFATSHSLDKLAERLVPEQRDVANGITVLPSGLIQIKPTPKNGLTLSGPIALRLVPTSLTALTNYCGVLDEATLKDFPLDYCQRVYTADGKLTTPIAELRLSVAMDDLPRLRDLLAESATPKPTDADKNGALATAVAMGLGEAASILIASGAGSTAKDVALHPLNMALRRGDTGMATLLYDRGIVPPRQTANDPYPLHFAVRSGRPEVVEFAISRGEDLVRADMARSLLAAQCTAHDSVAMTEWLLGKGIGAGQGYGSILATCMERQRQGIVKRLILRFGWRIDDEKQIQQVLKATAKAKDEPSFRALIAALPGTEADRAGRHGTLQHAVAGGFAGFLREVVAAGAGVDTRTALFEGTALELSLREHKAPVMANLLLELGADPRKVSNATTSMLSMAIRTGDRPLIRRLLDAGVPADIGSNEEGGKWETPIEVAAGAGYIDVIEWLLPKLKPLTADQLARALLAAIDGSSPQAVHAMLRLGADPNHVVRWSDFTGATSLVAWDQGEDVVNPNGSAWDILLTLLKARADPSVLVTSSSRTGFLASDECGEKAKISISAGIRPFLGTSEAQRESISQFKRRWLKPLRLEIRTRTALLDVQFDILLIPDMTEVPLTALSAFKNAGANPNGRVRIIRQEGRLTGAELKEDVAWLLDLVQGDTPLHVAAREGNRARMDALIALGANPKLRNAKGQLPRFVEKKTADPSDKR